MISALDKLALLASADLTGAEVALRQIPNDDPNGAFIPTVLDQVRKGTANLCEIHHDGKKIGFTVYTVESFGTHREFVSIATTIDSKTPLRFALDELLCRLARQNNCRSIRMHTARHGLVKNALAIGWHTAEITLRKHLTQ